MRKLLKTMRVLLVSALLGVGQSTWSADYTTTSTTTGVTTTTMNFYTYAFAKYSQGSSGSPNYTSNSVTTSNSQTLYLVDNFSDFTFYNYLALPNNNSNVSIRRSSKSSASATGDGLFAGGRKRYYMSLVNLHVGDVITFSVSNTNNLQFTSSNATYLISETPTAVVGGTTFVTSGTEYTISSGTQLDLYYGADANQNDYLGIITIKSQYDALTNPILEQTAAGTTSTIRITAGKCSNSGATVTTYYTTDGTIPSAENNEGSFTTTTKDVNITSNKTIKAISVTSGTYGGSSYVVSGDFEAVPAQLAAPTVSIGNFALSAGYYYPIYTFNSDQSGVVGYTDQALTYTYSFNSAAPVEASSYTATTTSGTLRVTVSADGFDSNYTDVAISGTQYTSTYFFDGSKIYDHATSTTAGDYNVNGAGCKHYTLIGMYINGLSTSGMSHAWAITADKSTGLSARNGSGSVTYTGDFPAGSYILAYRPGNTSGSGGWAVSETNTVSVNQYYAITSLRVLVPSASAEAYSLNNGTNLTSNGEFTSNVSGWDTKGTITKESDSSTSGNGFGWNGNGWAEMWADNNSASADYAHYNSDCYIAQRYVNYPAGDYYVSADLVANGGNVSVYTISVNGVAQETDNGYFDNWTTKAHVINVPSDNSTITIKYAPQTGGRAWVGIDNVSCIYDPSPSVTVSDAGFATYVNNDYDLDFTSTSIEAYKVKVSKKGVATLTKLTTVPAGTPVLLYKEDGATESIPVTTGAAAVTENDLVAGTGAAVPTTDGAGNTNMILWWDKDNPSVYPIGFYFANSQTVASNRAYLHIANGLAPDAAASRMVMVFADETTGVNDVRSKMSEVRGTYYNLNGQRVEKPAKGLYIVNGKKVIIK